MKWFTQALAVCLFGVVIPGTGAAQQPSVVDSRAGGAALVVGTSTATVSVTVARYYDPQTGATSADIVRRALASNGELLAARLDIERARARLRQSALRPNPTLDVEQTTGRLVGSPGERETSIGVTLPLEVAGRRGRRIDLARAELEGTEAEVADRERRLAGEVLALYTEALTALRELQITEGLTDIDLQTTRYVQARVSEGEAAPIELSLLQVEVDRMRSRRALVEGRLQAALLRLKGLAGIPAGEPLRLGEEITTPLLREPPGSVEAAVEIALHTRPDVRLARLTEEVAQAGLRLARAQAAPDVSAFTKFSISNSRIDNTPVGVLRDRDRALTFGVSVGLPVFNKNQGAREEAAITITQARTRRAFLEQTVRAEVMSAYARYESAQRALATFEQGVLERSNANIRSIRAAYQLGEFRITDLLTEQRRLLDAQRDFTDALAERYRALADLQQAIGTPVNPQER
jgi:cobalt-zinc-cadmium efflux system outer membrane protein